MPRHRIITEEQKEAQRQRVLEYRRNYYQKYKDEWNDYTPKRCECGLMTSDLWKHKKTKIHKDVMELRIQNTPTTNTN